MTSEVWVRAGRKTEAVFVFHHHGFKAVRQVAATVAHQIDQVLDHDHQLVGDEHAFDLCSHVLHGSP